LNFVIKSDHYCFAFTAYPSGFSPRTSSYLFDGGLAKNPSSPVTKKKGRLGCSNSQ
jgi:hypothetical protein